MYQECSHCSPSWGDGWGTSPGKTLHRFSSSWSFVGHYSESPGPSLPSLTHPGPPSLASADSLARMELNKNLTVLQKLSKEQQDIAFSPSWARSSQEQDSAEGQSSQLEAIGIWRNRSKMQPDVVKAMIESISWEEPQFTEERDCRKAFSCNLY